MTEARGIAEEVLHLSSPGVVHPHGTVHELHPTGFARRDNLIELLSIEGDGLLQQQVLLLLGGEHGPLDVQARGERDVDGVHLRVVEQGLVGPVDLGGRREAVVGAEFGGLLAGAAGDGVEGRIGGEGDRAGDLAGDLGAAQDSEFDRR